MIRVSPTRTEALLHSTGGRCLRTLPLGGGAGAKRVVVTIEPQPFDVGMMPSPIARRHE